MNSGALSSSLSPLRLLLLGYGSVTQAFLPLLASRRDWLAHELGVYPLVSGIGTRSRGFYIHPNGIPIDVLALQSEPFQWFANQAEHVDDAQSFIHAGKTVHASLLIELTALQPQDGQPALTYIRTAFEQGMDVVTANKGPIAYAQAELQALAQYMGRQFRFESTVMDGLPLLNLAQFTLQAVSTRAFHALLNTTSSLVLSMVEQGHTVDEAIRKAQQLGIAEADPWYDLDGWDAVMKTTILANNLLGGQLKPHMVKREGIRHLSQEAIRAAALEGAPIRLVSQARRMQGEIVAEVGPQRIGEDDILRIGKGTTGIISLETEAMGTISLVEHEPEVLQTAYGVLSDLITIQQHKIPPHATHR